jgi:hypothetical protein
MRDDVLTALKPFGVKILAFDCWGEGHYHLPVPAAAWRQNKARNFTPQGFVWNSDGDVRKPRRAMGCLCAYRWTQ